MTKEQLLQRYRSRYEDIASSPELDARMMAGIGLPLQRGIPLDEAMDLVARQIREGVASGAISTIADEQGRRSTAIAEIARGRGQHL
jgi:hypothetical protein